MGAGAGIFGENSKSLRFFSNGHLMTSGMNNSAEDYFMESDIVLVTINYRLGPLGFMAIPGTNIQVWETLRSLAHSSPGEYGHEGPTFGHAMDQAKYCQVLIIQK